MRRLTSFTVITPQTPAHWQAYYDLRWRILREPWQQPRGSERDDLEADAIHRAVVAGERIIGVGRLHTADPHTAQIRYMAVEPDYHRQGVASLLLVSLEAASTRELITLNSRESACGFYLKNGYELGAETHTLYGEIRHFVMTKKLIHP